VIGTAMLLVIFAAGDGAVLIAIAITGDVGTVWIGAGVRGFEGHRQNLPLWV